jgi:hypothetical protein
VRNTHMTLKALALVFLGCFLSVGVQGKPKLPPPSPIYLNLEPIEPPDVPPQIDALIFDNRSLFFVQDPAFVLSNPTFFLLGASGNSLYHGQSVLFWTNSGTMIGVPGFRFETLPDVRRLPLFQRRKRGAYLPKPAKAFVNEGDISVSAQLFIHSTNIVSSGRLEGDLGARITLYATNGLADLSSGAIREGRTTSPFAPPPFFFFNSDPQLQTLYGATGTNGVYNRTNGTPLFLPTAFFGATPPLHEVLVNPTLSGLPVTFRITNFLSSVPACSGSYSAFAEVTDSGFGGGKVVSVAFVETNSFIETNISVDVRFLNSFFGATPTIAVQYQSTEFDIIEQQVQTNVITFLDTGFISPMPPPTNAFQFFPSPSNYQLIRSRVAGFDFGSPGNSNFNFNFFYDQNFRTDTVTYAYSAVSLQVGPTNLSVFNTPATSPIFFGFNLGVHPAVADPTNFPSRIEVTAKDLNLNRTRIRAEQAIDIRASNLISNTLAAVDAPFLNFDVGTTNANLVISNLAPPVVNRAHGQLSAYSARWTATVTNAVTLQPEPVTYHVLIVGNCLQFSQPVILHRLALQATNLVIQDNLFVNNSIRLNAESLTISSNASIQLPIRWSWAFTNVQNLSHFTNFGVLNVPGAGAYFGAVPSGYVFEKPKRPRRRRAVTNAFERYVDFVNHGIVSAATISIDADYVENSGTIFNRAILQATNGPVLIVSPVVNVNRGLLTAGQNIQIGGTDVSLRDSVFSAGTTNLGVNVPPSRRIIPGALIISATNSLGDAGTTYSNYVFVTDGMRILHRPLNVGDFLGSSVYSGGGVFTESLHVWAGEDRGPTVEGFANNLALGRLTLDGAIGNLFRFRSASVSNAIYVDYLELLNTASTNYSQIFGIEPDFTIYFADSNIPAEKLDSLSGGRIRWVSEFVGPQSATNILYPDGNVYRFNAALVRSKDFDSDGDGIVNADDCTPIAVPGVDTTQPCPPLLPAAVSKSLALSTQNIGLAITISDGGREVILNWIAPANSLNTVEFSDSLSGDAWQPLTSFVNGPVDARATVKDALNAPLRVYRVRVDAQKP